MNTWHELMIVSAQFYAMGSEIAHDTSTIIESNWWTPGGLPLVAALSHSKTPDMARLERNAIRFNLTTIPYSPHEAGADYFREILADADWDDLGVDQLAGIVMQKRLLAPERTAFQFLTLWSVTQDIHYDTEGLKYPDYTLDLIGEFDVNTQAVNTQHTAFMMLWYAEYQAPGKPKFGDFTDTRELRRQLNLPALSNEFNSAVRWLSDHGMITLEKGSVWDFVTPTERGRAYLNGDILPQEAL